MLGTHDLLLFLATALVIALTPGIDMLYTLTRTLQAGARSGAVAAAGILAGCAVHAAAAATGLAALLTASATAFTVVKMAGAAYLLWLAAGMLVSAWRGAPLVLPPTAPTKSPRVVFAQGFLGNALNPKVALFFLALLPQFVDAGAGAAAFLFLGLLFIAVGSVVLAGVVLLAARARALLASARAARALNATAGTLFAALALRLALAERH